MFMHKVILAPSLALARTVRADVTVEAEYGSHVVEGTTFTAAHHQATGPFAGRHLGGTQPSPCNNEAIPALSEGTILISHVDLDTFGGVLRAMGKSHLFHMVNQRFWDLAEFVDVNGGHKLHLSGAVPSDIDALYAFWAWSRSTLPQFSREVVTDVTEHVKAAGCALDAILRGNPTLLDEGRVFRAQQDALNSASFVSLHDSPFGKVIVRKHETFTNHLYMVPGGEVNAAVIIAFNTEANTITVSFADEIPGVSTKDLVQSLWGSEAGGHAQIAGSPRGVTMTFGQVHDLLTALKNWSV
jgi:hypothetical protein